MQDNFLAEAWAHELIDVLQMMTMAEFQATTVTGPVPALNGSVCWDQPLSVAPEAALWIAAPSETWLDLGRRSLEAAGIEEVEEETARTTYLEIIQQSLGSFSRIVTSRLGKPVECKEGGERFSIPPTTAFRITLRTGSEELEPIYFHVPAALQSILSGDKPAPVATASEAVVKVEAPAADSYAASNNPIDLLLDVEMPVSISFGRAHLPLRDVLKFTAGSIVELNRHPDDPVEIMVNNRVIARGEVVVVDGNYGVRVQEIVSRPQRLAVRNFDRISSAR